jgi:type II secretion system protein C
LSYYKKQLKQILIWVLLALLIWTWVQFILFPAHQPSDIQSAAAPPSLLPDTQLRPAPSTYHIFGSSTTSEIPLSLLQAESSLDLIITGIMASGTPNEGRAFIRNRQGEEKLFQVGDDVYGLATLDEIHPDHLILKRGNSSREKLSLSKGREINTLSHSPRTVDQPVHAAASSRIANHINSSSDWQNMLDEQKFDASKIQQMASKVNVIRDGQGRIAGLKVSQLSGNSSLIKQGLRANDQIVAVNGVKISSQNVLKLQQELTGKDQASVTVMRNGRQLNLNLDLKEFQ